MKAISSMLGLAIAAGTLSACGIFASQTYCLEEQEKNNYDYMVVTDPSVCNNNTDDVEWFSTDQYLNYGDVAYVEIDGSHSKSTNKKKDQVKSVPNTKIPPYTAPATPRFAVPTQNQQAPRVNAPANNQNKVNSNSGNSSRGSSNSGSMGGGKRGIPV